MNKHEHVFAVKGVYKILEKVVLERKLNSFDSYHTLVKSIQEYLDLVWHSPLEKANDLIDTYKDLSKAISKELNELETIINTSLDTENYKAHYKWLMSYQKLSREKYKLEDLIKRMRKEINWQKYKNGCKLENK